MGDREQREAVFAGPQWLAPAILGTILLFHLFMRGIHLLMRKERMRPEETKLLKEIKQLEREANALSTPSTFAKAAKLRRIVVTKEKELNGYKQLSSQSKIGGLLLKRIMPMLLKASLYIFMLWRFWRTPVSLVPASLLQPFDWVFSISKNEQVHGTFSEIRIIPWLVLSTNISVFLSKCLLSEKPASRKL